MLVVIFNAIYASIIDLIAWNKMLETKVDFKKGRVCICILFMLISLVLNSIMVDPILKIIVVLLIFNFSIKYIYNTTMKQSMILSIVTQLIYIISELLIIIIVLIITNINSNAELVETFFGTIYANIVIGALVYLIIHFPIVKNIYIRLLNLIENQKIYSIAIVSYMIIITISVVLNFIFYRDNLILTCCIGLMVLIVYLSFIVNDVIMRNKYLNMYTKYNDTLETLKSYEDILDKYRVSNHENKNQLLTIRNMLKKNDHGAVKFIDNLVQNEYKDDEDLMFETAKIPSGGLRALIYSKLLYMKNNNLNFTLKIDRKMRSVELINMDQDIVLNMCKIVGVFLDNAIEEVKKTGKGTVGIELYMLDDKLNISISNTFEGAIDLDKISNIKYTTKGVGHGYGLALVKEILSKQKSFSNVKMVNDNVFIQILKIDI